MRRLFKSEHIDINLAKRRFSGSDVSDQVELVEAQKYLGMMEPIPLLVPKLNSASLGGHTFRVRHGKALLIFHSSSVEDGQYIGEVYEKGADGRARRALTYRYTEKRGIYEIQVELALGISSSHQILRKCGGVPLFAQ